MSELLIRKAEIQDIPFLSNAIYQADRSGNKSSYCTLFKMDKDDFIQLSTHLFEMELENCEFDIKTFVVIEHDNKPIGACSGWIEGFDDIPSWQTKFAGFRYALPPAKLEYFLSIQNDISGLLPERKKNTLQIESVFIDQSHRGKGLLKTLIDFQVKQHRAAHPSSMEIELITYANNQTAIQAYSKLGFITTASTTCLLNHITSQYPYNRMIKMTKYLS